MTRRSSERRPQRCCPPKPCRGAVGATGARGPEGPPGPEGPEGPPGPGGDGPAGSLGEVQINGGVDFAAAPDVRGGNAYLEFGPLGTTATIGNLRFLSLFSAWARSEDGLSNIPVLSKDEFDVVYLGDYFGSYVSVGSYVTLGVLGTDYFVVTDQETIFYNERIVMGLPGSPTITVGLGPPTAAEPNASQYMQKDGGVGSTFWIRVAGVWTAIA